MTSDEIIEQCACIAEAIDVPCHGHPQIDAPTIGDARKVIASAIRKLKTEHINFNKKDVRHHDYHDWTHPLIREDRPE